MCYWFHIPGIQYDSHHFCSSLNQNIILLLNWLIQNCADEESSTNLPTSVPIWLERIAINMACSIRSFSGISDVDTHDSRIRLLSILFISGKNLVAILVKRFALICFSWGLQHWLCLRLEWGVGGNKVNTQKALIN